MSWTPRTFQPVTISSSSGDVTIVENTVVPVVIRGMVLSYAATTEDNVTLNLWTATEQGNTGWLISSMILAPGDRVEWDVPITLDKGDSLVGNANQDYIQVTVWGVADE